MSIENSTTVSRISNIYSQLFKWCLRNYTISILHIPHIPTVSKLVEKMCHFYSNEAYSIVYISNLCLDFIKFMQEEKWKRFGVFGFENICWVHIVPIYINVTFYSCFEYSKLFFQVLKMNSSPLRCFLIRLLLFLLHVCSYNFSDQSYMFYTV